MAIDRFRDAGMQAPTSGLAGGEVRADAPPSVDWAAIRHAMRDVRIWLSKAEVIEVVDDTGTDEEEQILDIRVRLMPGDIEMFAEWSGPYIGPSHGDWFEPAVGDHCIVGVCAKHEGDNEEAIILGGLWSKAHPKPNVSAAGKRLMIVRPGDSLEIQASEGGGVRIDVNGAGDVTIDCQDRIDLISRSSCKFDTATLLELIGPTVAAHDGGARFAVVLVNELNSIITAINSLTVLLAAHKHPTAATGPPSVPDNLPYASIGAASGASILEAE